MATALVDEVVHLLGDDVGGLAESLEHAEVFQQRRDDLAITGRTDHVGEHLDELPPARRLRREDVAHPGTGLELGHGSQAYRRSPTGPGEYHRREAPPPVGDAQIILPGTSRYAS